jgi:hypothetical protein
MVFSNHRSSVTGLLTTAGGVVWYRRSRWIRTSLPALASIVGSPVSEPDSIEEASVRVRSPKESAGVMAVMRIPESKFGLSIKR